MHYLVSVNHNGMAEMPVTVFKKCCVSNAIDGIDDDMWNDSE
jgi:hypothetical protein